MATMSDDLTARITAALDQIEEGNDWPHRRSCQMLKPVPEGFPFPTFTCNCDVSTFLLDLISAHREILAEHCDNGRGFCLGCGLTNDDRYVSGVDDCPTRLALAKAHRVEVPDL